MKEVFFFFFGFLSAAFAIMAVLNRNLIKGGVSLLASFVSLAGVYFSVGAEFIGIVQVIVYGGAIIVLYLFALLTMDIKSMKAEPLRLSFLFAGGFLSGALFLLILYAGLFLKGSLSSRISTAYDLAHPLFYKFLLPFEVVSVLLLVATIGAVAVARREE